MWTSKKFNSWLIYNPQRHAIAILGESVFECNIPIPVPSCVPLMSALSWRAPTFPTKKQQQLRSNHGMNPLMVGDQLNYIPQRKWQHLTFAYKTGSDTSSWTWVWMELNPEHLLLSSAKQIPLLRTSQKRQCEWHSRISFRLAISLRRSLQVITVQLSKKRTNAPRFHNHKPFGVTFLCRPHSQHRHNLTATVLKLYSCSSTIIIIMANTTRPSPILFVQIPF